MLYGRIYGLPRWRVKSPFEDLERMRRQINQLLEGFSELSPQFTTDAGVYPAVNLTENRENFFIRAELPGVRSENLDIQATATSISIAGERKIPTEKGVKYHRREREPGSFSRMIGLPAEIDPDHVKASMANGILTIQVPKAEKARPKQITVN